MLEILASLSALILMEIVLGIDNIIFIALLADRLPEARRASARFMGLGIALVGRVIFLFGISWLIAIKSPLFSIMDQEISLRDLILLAGGLFLVAKATHEIYEKLEVPGDPAALKKTYSGFGMVIFQIVLLDLVFSIDSVLTAVGMVKELWMMVTAVVVAILVMMAASGGISRFVNRHPSVKILALAFLIMIGVLLITDGLGQHINRGYIYFAMFFSLSVELINMRVRAVKNR